MANSILGNSQKWTTNGFGKFSEVDYKWLQKMPTVGTNVMNKSKNLGETASLKNANSGTNPKFRSDSFT